jgi:hypothetical protein
MREVIKVVAMLVGAAALFLARPPPVGAGPTGNFASVRGGPSWPET